MTKKVDVNNEKRTVTVTLTCDEGTFRGVAKCLKTDHFDPVIGEKIAYKRALLQVKKVDIDIFKKEMDACDEILNKVELLKIRQRRAKANYKKAKAQLSNIHAEIEKLKQAEPTVVEKTQQRSLAGRYFIQNLKSSNKKCIHYKLIQVIEELSNFQSKVYVTEVSMYNSGTFQQNTQNSYLDILYNDVILNMDELSAQDFDNFIITDTYSKTNNKLFKEILGLLNF
jgi:hypothetical protein